MMPLFYYLLHNDAACMIGHEDGKRARCCCCDLDCNSTVVLMPSATSDYGLVGLQCVYMTTLM